MTEQPLVHAVQVGGLDRVEPRAQGGVAGSLVDAVQRLQVAVHPVVAATVRVELQHRRESKAAHRQPGHQHAARAVRRQDGIGAIWNPVEGVADDR